MTAISIDGYEPKHLSHSTVSGYRDCGMRFKLQKILRVEQRPGLAGIGGNAVHSATEWYDVLYAADPANFNPVAAFEQAWHEEIERRKADSPSFNYPDDYVATGRASAEHGGKRGVSWWMEQGPIMVQRWIDWRAEHKWSIWETPEGNPAIELELNIVLPGASSLGAARQVNGSTSPSEADDVTGIPVKMFIDRLMVTPAGQLVVCDIKTGRSPETPEQLGLYAVGIEQTFGTMFRPDWGYFWDAQKGAHSSPQALDLYTADYFADMYSQAVRGIQAGCFLAKPANNCKSWCGTAAYCPAVGGTLPESARR